MKLVGSGLMGKILIWKKQYGSVYYIKIGSNEYIYRLMSRGDHIALLSAQQNIEFNIEDVVLQECLLYPKFSKRTFDKRLAGEVEYVAQCIAESSGFSETERVEVDLDQQRQSLGNLENQMTVLICKAFPHLKLSDINNFTYDELIRYVSISEAILDVKLNIEKPKTNKGTVDFSAENRAMGGVPFDKNLNPPRGDANRKT
jgi:hypothetical protein